MKTRIAIAEDNNRVLEIIVQKLAPQPDFEVCITAGNGASLLEQMDTCMVDIVLMDIEMPEMNGIEACAAVTRNHPDCKVLMLTTFDDDEKIFQSILSGAIGYLLKEISGAELVHSIQQTLAGGAAMSASIALRALQYIRTVEAQKSRMVVSREACLLTPREIELLELLKDGLGYKQIGARLSISEGTVRKHLENVYRKLQVNNKVSAINAAAGKNWI